uniref:Uncharacterized protein n=1 Tax=Molossus molossus TaxID=27622 RepID=A0A7J8BAW2_MOLMO|nr:hypothetical protein HJG59_010465 [Molossus molossus]
MCCITEPPQVAAAAGSCVARQVGKFCALLLSSVSGVRGQAFSPRSVAASGQGVCWPFSAWVQAAKQVQKCVSSRKRDFSRADGSRAPHSLGSWLLSLVRKPLWGGRQAVCTHLSSPSLCWASVTGSHPASMDSRKCSHWLRGHVPTKTQVGFLSLKGGRGLGSLQSLPQFTSPYWPPLIPARLSVGPAELPIVTVSQMLSPAPGGRAG